MKDSRVHSTSTRQELGKGPEDMPSSGGDKPKLMGNPSTMVPLSRKEHPVAQFGAHPGMGKVLSNSTTANLSRNTSNPYQKDGVSATTPEVPLRGRGKRK